MGQFIQVKASNPGHAGTYTPNRFWPNGQIRKLEVVDDEVAVAWLDKHKPQRRGNEDAGARALDVAGGPYLSNVNNVLTPDPERITKSGVEAVRANGHLSSIEEGEGGGAMAQAALDAAREHARRVGEKLVDAEMRVASLEEQVARLNDEKKASAEAYGKLGVELNELLAENELLKKQVAPGVEQVSAAEGGKTEVDDKGKPGKPGKSEPKAK